MSLEASILKIGRAGFFNLNLKTKIGGGQDFPVTPDQELEVFELAAVARCENDPPLYRGVSGSCCTLDGLESSARHAFSVADVPASSRSGRSWPFAGGGGSSRVAPVLTNWPWS